MKLRYLLPLALISLLLFSCQSKREVQLDIIHTTDAHGRVFPYDFINDQPADGGYLQVAHYVDSIRALKGREVVLLDAGDILQGQPSAYYFNFIDTTSVHVIARVMNSMQYDALTIGNHDIETGHSVYDKFVKKINFPALAANVRKKGTQEPYFSPYVIIHRAGLRIAVLGLTMPNLIHQLPEVLWEGLTFEDQISVAKEYLPEVLQKEPDFIIALIHSGAGSQNDEMRMFATNVGYDIAKEIPELDLVLMGHDHRQTLDSIQHSDGSMTYLLNPANDARAISHTRVTFTHGKEGRSVKVDSQLVVLRDGAPSQRLMDKYQVDFEKIKEFVSVPVGNMTTPLNARSVFFGPSAFIDLIHQLQFFVYPEAQVSITAPLQEDGEIAEGPVYMRDLFKLYKYENMLYLMDLTGAEIKGLLEESYNNWIMTMSKPEDPLLRLDSSKLGGRYLPFEVPTFNFDSAAGISYTVDVTKGKGNRVVVTKVGTEPFALDNHYKVAINSYRGNGGGGLLTERGAGIPVLELPSRVIKSTEKDLRWYLIDFLRDHDPFTPQIISDWQFIPRSLVEPALVRDSLTLYSKPTT
ncbi:MAG: bifunctional UDP-sugar hydrolase/5'-nucleotidase [Porphyromonas sp.]|nr:bifunctional UDP-sugar hydrolase/5'-nucleotidase [Porphyromonas sp.]